MNDTTTAPADPGQRTDPRSLPTPASLKSLQTFPTYQRHRKIIFPSISSLAWFYQKHRSALIECGAVVELAGRRLINVPIFEQKALEIGTRAAAARGQR